jgi:hypothetical protein
MSKTAEYRIRLAQLIVPTPVMQPKPSLCYPDRHRRSDKQVAVSTVRYMASTLVFIAVALGVALAVR